MESDRKRPWPVLMYCYNIKKLMETSINRRKELGIKSMVTVEDANCSDSRHATRGLVVTEIQNGDTERR
jgi:hypothetical protein